MVYLLIYPNSLNRHQSIQIIFQELVFVLILYLEIATRLLLAFSRSKNICSEVLVVGTVLDNDDCGLSNSVAEYVAPQTSHPSPY
jgi:hypothetical protein